jgi:hypothetical protein
MVLASSRLKTLHIIGEARIRENFAGTFVPFGAAGQGTLTGCAGFGAKMKYFPEE